MSGDEARVKSEVDPAVLRYGADGLLPVVVQEVASGAVLMLAWADRAAVERTLATGEAHFWSRSRQRPWKKGETSGNVLTVVEVAADCDGDALLVRADPAGPTCHRGTRSCFDSESPGTPTGPRLELGWLWEVVEERRGGDPATSYTARLLAGGAERAAQKVGEEATEVVIAGLAAAGDFEEGRVAAAPFRAELAGETADLLYHLLVLLAAAGGDPAEVAAELRRRHLPEPSRAARTAPPTDRGGDGRG